jgi:hypothetical protein
MTGTSIKPPSTRPAESSWLGTPLRSAPSLVTRRGAVERHLTHIDQVPLDHPGE